VITAVTNIVEKYHHFLDLVCFGKDGTITENDPIEQEKRFKYLDLGHYFKAGHLAEKAFAP